MRRIIHDKVYDTDTAKLQATGYYQEELFLKKTGEYFLYDAENKKITPLTYEEAKSWAKEKLGAEEYMALFEISDDSDLSDILKSIRRPTGLNKSDFAEKYKIPIGTYEKWERGENYPSEYLVELLKFKVEYDLTKEKK